MGIQADWVAKMRARDTARLSAGVEPAMEPLTGRRATLGRVYGAVHRTAKIGFTEPQWEKLDATAADRNMSVSALIRALVEAL